MSVEPLPIAPFDKWAFRCSAEDLRALWPHRFETPDEGCAVCSWPEGRCQCKAEGFVNIGLDAFCARIERGNQHVWLRKFLVGDMQCGDHWFIRSDDCAATIFITPERLIRAFDKRFVAGACVWCGPLQCCCTSDAWALMQVRDFFDCVVAKHHGWLITHLRAPRFPVHRRGSVRRNPRRAVRGTADPNYARDGEALHSKKL